MPRCWPPCWLIGSFRSVWWREENREEKKNESKSKSKKKRKKREIKKGKAKGKEQHTRHTQHIQHTLHTQQTTHSTHNTTTHHQHHTLHHMHTPDNRPWSRECLRQEKSECVDMCSTGNRPWSWGSFNVNARICACQTTDRDLVTKKWMLGYVHLEHNAFFIYNCNHCNACNACFFYADVLFSI